MWRGLLVLALALRLLVDMATPLMPGAFRFDPHESVEGLRTYSVRGAHDAAVRPSPSPQRTDEIVVTDAAPARLAPEGRAPRFHPLLARQRSDRASAASEDH
jgi:hypothetical protein